MRGAAGRGAGRARRRWARALGLLVLGLAAAVTAASLYVEAVGRRRLLADPGAAPPAPVALVFGAGLAQGGVPSPVLAERLAAAHALWSAGRVERILVSGDNSERHHNETRAMARWLRARGVPQEALLEDAHGLSTFDTCARAVRVFGVRRALLVTQEFHLPRALYFARALGLDAWGVPADAHRAGVRRPYAVREFVSRALALVWVVARLPGEAAPDAPAALPPRGGGERSDAGSGADAAPAPPAPDAGAASAR